MTQRELFTTVFVLAAALMVTNCGPRSAPASNAQAPVASVDEEARCRQLGLKVYDDVRCQAEQKERQARFLGKDPGR